MKKITKGVTLVELLIYMALVSLFMIILVELFTSILKLELTTQSTTSLASDTRFIVARMGYDIENAKSISVPSPLGQTATSLTFQDTSGTTFTYARDGSNNLTLNGTQINSSDTSISDITFQRIGFDIAKPSTVQVKFTITSNITETSGPRSQIIQTTYGTR
jgi:type II secretory pathway component PulJ